MTDGDDAISPWRATAAHHRALVVASVVLLIGVLARRPDLVIVAAPFAVLAAWSLYARPNGIPSATARLSPTVIHEGQSVGWVADVAATPGTEDVVAVLAPSSFVVTTPRYGVVARAVDPQVDVTGRTRLTATLTAVRWGEREVALAIVTATTAFGAFRWSPPQLPAARIRVLPAKEPFTARVGMPHPQGIVGLNRSARRGEGTDFATVRPYVPGDRMRRINWPVSTRVGELHVTATHADQDAYVQIVVDAFHDIGVSQGVGGARSSLDTAVRAAAALTEHYLRAGERVGLLVLGASRLQPLPASAGRTQLRRVLDTLAMIRPGSLIPSQDNAIADHHLSRTPAGAVVIVLTPGVSDRALGMALSLGKRGLTTVLVDTLPRSAAHGLLAPDELHAIAPMTEPRELRATHLAWRLRLLERGSHLGHLRASGIPVIEWTGPGSLDEVLRQLHRRARAPRPVRR